MPGTQRGPSEWCFASEPGLRALARGRPERRALFLKAAAVPALFLGALQFLSFMVLRQLRLRVKRGFFPSLSASWCETRSKFCNVSEPQLPRNNMTGVLEGFDDLICPLLISQPPPSTPSRLFSKEWPDKPYKTEIGTCFLEHTSQCLG